MAETRTTRFGLPQWSSGSTDSPSRSDFNEAFANLDKWAARFESGTLNARPAPGIPGRYYTDDGGTIYRDTGTSWVEVGIPKSGLNLTYTSGTNPLVRLNVPANHTSPTFQTFHGGSKRFEVTGTGDLVSGSVRVLASDVPPVPENYLATLAVKSRNASMVGVTILGASGQTGDLLDLRNDGGSKLTQFTSSGDLYGVGRGSFGSVSPEPSQVFVANASVTRPTILARSGTDADSGTDVVVLESKTGQRRHFGVNGRGQATFGDNESTEYVNGDVVALNTNYRTKNQSADRSPIPRGRFAFRNTSSKFGVAGIEALQLFGDDSNAAALSLFAGQATSNGQAPERLRLGLTAEKINAYSKALDAGTIPLVLEGAQGQSTDLLLLQDTSKNALFRFRPNGNIEVAGSAAISGPLTAPNATVADQVAATRFTADAGTSGTSPAYLAKIDTSNTGTADLFRGTDQNGARRATIDRLGKLHIVQNQSIVPDGAEVMTIRGVPYRQIRNQLQSFDSVAQRWVSPLAAFTAEYYTSEEQWVNDRWVPIKFGTETYDSENFFDHTPNTSVVTVPVTGWYDVRALTHVKMNFVSAGSGTFRINGVNEMKYRRDYPRSAGFEVCTISLNDLVYLNKGDRIEFMCLIETGTFSAKVLDRGDYRSRMSIRFAGY